ncbi:MAG TPA: hypothetical protein VH835_16350 [Dongiaceae bacterium]
MSKHVSALSVALAFMLGAAPAFAYVGPGAGLSLIGAFWALILAVFTALFFLIAWPVRRMLRNARARGSEPAPSRNDPDDGPLAG